MIRRIWLFIAVFFLVPLNVSGAVSISADPAGLVSLTRDGVQYLGSGPACLATKLVFHRGNSQTPMPPGSGISTVWGKGNEVVVIGRTYKWGGVRCTYSIIGDRVQSDVVISNRTPDGIAEIGLRLLNLVSPSAPFSGMPGSGYNSEGPEVIFIPFGAVKLLVADEQVARQLTIKPAQIPGGMGIFLDSTVNKTLSPITDGDPYRMVAVERSIPPGGSDSYSLSLRFANQTVSPQYILHDLFQRWAARFPSTLNWPDRRPIGQLVLASHARTTPFNPLNPRYWIYSDPKVDINSEIGRERFKERLLAEVDLSVANLKAENAQGVIVWDIEGEQFLGLQYVGDPRHLPPEMEPVADEFFKRITRAGLRCGLALAVRQLMSPGAGGDAFQLTSQTTRRYVDDPDQLFHLLDQTVGYSRRRWGCTLFYVDADGNAAWPSPFITFQRLVKRYPDVLIIPEHKDLAYYASTAPYCEERLGEGLACPSKEARWIYPKAFSVIKVDADPGHGPNPLRTVERVQNGDALLIISWEPPTNPRVRRAIDIRQRTLERRMP